MVLKIENLFKQGLENYEFYLTSDGERINLEDLALLETRKLERRNVACPWSEVEGQAPNADFSTMTDVKRVDGVMFYTLDYLRQV